ncbi:fibronectin type III domain-containing protein [Patescibacteria group bacterium]|nr:MAG: fibronectin type III domain-containing protein [Patescibacteria group bacterium]
MENDPIPVPKSPSFNKRKVLLIIVSVVMVLIVSVIAVFILRWLTLSSEVKAVLESVPSAMTTASAEGGNGYPMAIPLSVKTDTHVTLSGGGTFDGTIYCVTGAYNTDQSIIYHVSSSNAQVASGACAPVVKVSKPTSVLSPIQGIVSPSQVGVTWLPVKDAASYSVQCATDQSFTQNVTKSTAAANQNQCINLHPLTTYYARVRANNSAGAGPWSQPIVLKTTVLSVAPDGLTITVKSATDATYSWLPVSGATSYVLQGSTDTSYENDVITKTVTTTSGTLTGLKPHTVYYFHVKAVTAQFDAAHAAYSGGVGILTLAR